MENASFFKLRLGVLNYYQTATAELTDYVGQIACERMATVVIEDAARIEEEVVVTENGCEVISLFPAEELPISNRY